MKSKFLLALASIALLASCGGNGDASHATGLSSSEESTAQAATYLDWVGQGKLVIDLIAIGEARFTYGNAALDKASNTLDLNDNAALACATQFEAAQTFNFVFVTEATAGTGFNAGAAVYPGIEGDKIGEFLSGSNDLQGKARAYVAISFGATVQWTKGKNAAMDAKIQQLVDATK